jgi:hypothetical protein
MRNRFCLIRAIREIRGKKSCRECLILTDSAAVRPAATKAKPVLCGSSSCWQKEAMFATKQADEPFVVWRQSQVAARCEDFS